ncbi:MAG: type II toxin-antitoxin system antitoxin, RelB/DinJ family [Oscillibacter sp.]|nr:type II toxin-antitoxin system antitoxin, RelB/DinJ family [Oscillibacter sp.]
MAGEVTLQIPMDAEMKEKVEALYARMGTTFAEAVRIFAAQSLLVNGMPLTMRAYPGKGRAYGILSQYASPELIEREKDAFDLAMKEKYGDAD